MATTSASKWPKVLAPLNAEQQRISDAFMKLWHEQLPGKYGVIEKFNHRFPARNSQKQFTTTLEIGAGLGEHLHYENLTPEQERNYYACELRENMANEIRQRFPKIQVIQGDCQKRLPFEDGYFDRAIAVHVLEHLPDLPGTIREMYRLLNKQRGRFLVVIPAEGSLAYTLARKISAERLFNRHFPGGYKWFISREHLNVPEEVLEELNPYFTVSKKTLFPIPFIPALFCNLCIGLVLTPRPVVHSK